MAALTVQNINRPGIVVTFDAAAAGGDTFTNTGHQQLWIKNDDVSAKDVTVVTTKQVDGNAVADLAVTQVPASGIVAVGPFFVDTYGSTVSITYSAVTSLSVAVVRPT